MCIELAGQVGEFICVFVNFTAREREREKEFPISDTNFS